MHRPTGEHLGVHVISLWILLSVGCDGAEAEEDGLRRRDPIAGYPAGEAAPVSSWGYFK